MKSIPLDKFCGNFITNARLSIGNKSLLNKFRPKFFPWKFTFLMCTPIKTLILPTRQIPTKIKSHFHLINTAKNPISGNDFLLFFRPESGSASQRWHQWNEPANHYTVLQMTFPRTAATPQPDFRKRQQLETHCNITTDLCAPLQAPWFRFQKNQSAFSFASFLFCHRN